MAFVQGAYHPRARRRSASVVVCSAAVPPTDMEATVRLASASLSQALAAGHKRLRVVALIPGLNPQVEDTFPFSSATLNNLALRTLKSTAQLAEAPSSALLFASTGTAQSAQAQYNRDGVAMPQGCCVASFDEPCEHVNMLIAPITSRGDPVLPSLQRSIDTFPDAIWVLLNGDFGADRAAVGMRQSAERDAFVKSFVNAYYVRNLFTVNRPSLKAVEKGVLMHCYAGSWQLFSLKESYSLIEEYHKMPSIPELTCILNEVSNNALKGPIVSNTVDRETLRVVAFCLAFVLYMFIAFRMKALS